MLAISAKWNQYHQGGHDPAVIRQGKVDVIVSDADNTSTLYVTSPLAPSPAH
ncbi:hypothetical protein LP420_28775 [Massilia sp. B-10]|nr:hypothetical protein LP420_28775 [Massilia sp. B-10]UUZ52962.1 hypothetical protein LP419_28335 [Massilia sp. H-1]